MVVNKKIIPVLCIAGLVFTHTALAVDDKSDNRPAHKYESKNNWIYSVAYEKGNNKNLIPKYSFEYYWNALFFSGVMYKQTEKNTIADLSSMSSSLNSSNSRLTTTFSTKQSTVTVLGLQKEKDGLRYAVAGELQFFELDRFEFGYGQTGDAVAVIENTTNIEVIKPGIRFDIGLENENKPVMFRSRLFLYPKSSLSLNQYSDFKPTTIAPGTSDTSEAQDISWEADLSLLVKTGTLVNFGAKISYQKEPLKYKIATVNADLSGYDQVTVESEDITFEWEVFLLFGKPDNNMNYVSLGFGERSVSSKVGGDSMKSTEEILSLGLTKMF